MAEIKPCTKCDGRGDMAYYDEFDVYLGHFECKDCGGSGMISELDKKCPNCGFKP